MGKRIIFLGLVLLLIAGAAGFFLANQEGFTGSRVKNPDAYLLDARRMQGTDLHTMELLSGDALQIHFSVTKGAVNLQIQAPDGTTLYRGNGKEITDFTVTIPESGVYSIIVEARRWQGTIEIRLKENVS